ncbi:UNVERIFIED_CONTAM: hypothetical protein FKN15_070777 [Acipenser sinensis]
MRERGEERSEGEEGEERKRRKRGERERSNERGERGERWMDGGRERERKRREGQREGERGENPPTVTLSLHPQAVLEGERVIFTCTATANPDILGFRWAKGGVILEGEMGSVYEAFVDHSFFTEPVSCEVHNAVGSTNVSTLVDVHFGPRIVVEPRLTSVDVGSDVTLTCVWSGNPPLTLTWIKKGSNMVLSNNNQLYLKSVSQTDGGQYICKAIVPRIGVGEREVTLSVNGKCLCDVIQEAVYSPAKCSRL